MMPQEKNIELMDLYLQGQLDDQQRIDFEQRLNDDDNFKKEFEDHRDFVEVIKEEGNKDLKAFLQEIEAGSGSTSVAQASSTNTPEGPKGFNWGRFALGFLAGLILFFGIVCFSNKDDQTPADSQIETEQLFASNFNAYPNELVRLERSGDEPVSDLQKIMILYNQKKYSEVIPAIDTYMQSAEDKRPLFYKAVSLLASDQDQESIALLEQLDKMDNYEFAEGVNWYLGLAYLKTGQESKAKAQLQEIVDNNQEYKLEEAKQLLTQL